MKKMCAKSIEILLEPLLIFEIIKKGAVENDDGDERRFEKIFPLWGNI